jgi:hypothetical protein
MHFTPTYRLAAATAQGLRLFFKHETKASLVTPTRRPKRPRGAGAGVRETRSDACSDHFGSVAKPAARSFVGLGLASSPRSIDIGAVLAHDRRFARNLADFRGGDRAIICTIRFCGQHQVRSLWAPAITNAELDRFNVTLFKQLREFRLVPIGEKPDRP